MRYESFCEMKRVLVVISNVSSSMNDKQIFVLEFFDISCQVGIFIASIIVRKVWEPRWLIFTFTVKTL